MIWYVKVQCLFWYVTGVGLGSGGAVVIWNFFHISTSHQSLSHTQFQAVAAGSGAPGWFVVGQDWRPHVIKVQHPLGRFSHLEMPCCY